MITAKHEERLISRISGMSELELESLFEELVERLGKDKKLHVVTQITGSDEIDELTHEIEELQEELEEVKSERDDFERWNMDAYNALDAIDPEDDPEDIQKAIDKVKSILG